MLQHKKRIWFPFARIAKLKLMKCGIGKYTEYLAKDIYISAHNAGQYWVYPIVKVSGWGEIHGLTR